jgi:hypothetical protein
MTQIVTFLITIISFLLGYFIGHNNNKGAREITQELKRKIDYKTSPVGVVKRPTQIDILKRTDPFTKKIEEGNKAMSETLAGIKELK